MGFNRIVDRRFDARNPRTRTARFRAARWALRAGLDRRSSWPRALFIAGGVAAQPAVPRAGPVALAWVLFYSYTKRFTRWPHLGLGLASPSRRSAGISPSPAAWSHAVVDARRARARGGDVGGGVRHSLRAAGRGVRSGARASERGGPPRRAAGDPARAKLLHGVTIPALALFGWGAGFGGWYFAGLAVAARHPLYEHSARPARRSVEARRRVLHDERGDERDRLRVRACWTGSSEPSATRHPVGRSRSRARRARRTRVRLLESLARAAACRCGSSSRATACACCGTSAASIRSTALCAAHRSATGRSVTLFPDDDRGAAAGVGLRAHARDGDLPVLDGHGVRDRRPAPAGRWSSAPPT